MSSTLILRRLCTGLGLAWAASKPKAMIEHAGPKRDAFDNDFWLAWACMGVVPSVK